MSFQAEQNEHQHTLQMFDGELNKLNSLMLEMAGLVASQLEQTMQALDDGDLDRAHKVILRDDQVNQYEISIDAEVLQVLARQCPVANDLRTVISTSKIIGELEKIGDEIVEVARLVMVLFDPKTSDPNPKLLTDIVKMGNLVKLMLDKLLLLLESKQASQAYSLLQYDRDCEQELHEGIKHQLGFVVQDIRMIGRALDIMQIMKSLERCGESCRNIAEYMIFMIEGVDIRHRVAALH